MAHFAQINDQNVVVDVTVIDNDAILNDNGVEDESIGIALCKEYYGQETTWVQTSYNGTIRKNYAGIGYSYNPDHDAFIAPKPFNSWVLNEETCQWEAPIARPSDSLQRREDGSFISYQWNDETQSWVLIP